MNITNAQYVNETHFGKVVKKNASIKAIIDDVTIWVPIQVGNRHYDEIMRQVASGELTITDNGGTE